MTSRPSKRPQLFYGWLIVFVSAIGLFLGAPLFVFSFSVFFKSLVLDFHASRAAVSFAFSLFNLVGALWLPCTGVLIDRFGASASSSSPLSSTDLPYALHGVWAPACGSFIFYSPYSA
jgi:MFS family permease